MRKTHLWLLHLFLFLVPCFVYAQSKTTTHQNLFWMRLMVQSSLSKRLYLVNEIDNRRFFEANTQHHTIQHNHLHFRVKPNFDVALGQTFSWQNPQFPNATMILTVPEVRSFQELNATQMISSKIAFSTRLRVEERFVRKNNGIELLDGHNFNMRYRFKLQYQFWLGKNKKDNLKLSNELMVNSGANVNFFDQNRLYLGFEHNFTKKLSVEIGYLRWYQQRTQFDTYFQRDIVRFTLFNRINFSKK